MEWHVFKGVRALASILIPKYLLNFNYLVVLIFNGFKLRGLCKYNNLLVYGKLENVSHLIYENGLLKYLHL